MLFALTLPFSPERLKDQRYLLFLPYGRDVVNPNMTICHVLCVRSMKRTGSQHHGVSGKQETAGCSVL